MQQAVGGRGTLGSGTLGTLALSSKPDNVAHAFSRHCQAASSAWQGACALNCIAWISLAAIERLDMGY
jgi:hypothetical protein